MDSIVGIGLRGIHVGLEQATESAARITRAFQPDSTESDLITPITELQSAARQVEASSKVVKIGDSLMGAILDIIG